MVVAHGHRSFGRDLITIPIREVLSHDADPITIVGITLTEEVEGPRLNRFRERRIRLIPARSEVLGFVSRGFDPAILGKSGIGDRVVISIEPIFVLNAAARSPVDVDLQDFLLGDRRRGVSSPIEHPGEVIGLLDDDVEVGPFVMGFDLATDELGNGIAVIVHLDGDLLITVFVFEPDVAVLHPEMVFEEEVEDIGRRVTVTIGATLIQMTLAVTVEPSVVVFLGFLAISSFHDGIGEVFGIVAFVVMEVPMHA